jgi:hypothetical protein
VDTILGIPLGESYSNIHALLDLSMCVNLYRHRQRVRHLERSVHLLVEDMSLYKELTQEVNSTRIGLTTNRAIVEPQISVSSQVSNSGEARA